MDAIEQLRAQLNRWTFKAGDGGPNTEAEISSVERGLSRRLPEDYRWFCLTHGDGTSNGVELSIELADGATAEFDRFGDANNLRFANDFYQPPDYPPGLIPCASTLLADVFFLRLGPGDDDGVWYWGSYEGRNPHHELVKAADSFTDLLASAVLGPNND